MKTLNQIEQEDVPAQLMDEYQNSNVLLKSMAIIRSHAKRMDEIRKSPDRYNMVKGKINTKNRVSSNNAQRSFSKRSAMGASQIICDEKSTGPLNVDLANAILTKANLEKIEMRDREIAEKEAEL